MRQRETERRKTDRDTSDADRVFLATGQRNNPSVFQWIGLLSEKKKRLN